MPAVLVHGVPDTHRLWRPVSERLSRTDVVALSLPGFGASAPERFDATKEAYVAWLLDQLRSIEGPIDLVGHDWGGMLVLRAVSVEPQLVRSWVAGGSPVDAEYVWHDTAQAWQKPEVGEQIMAATTPEVIGASLQAGGVPGDLAKEAASHVDATMKDCILKLYRSALNVGREWEAGLADVSAPGLVLFGEDDPFVEPRFGERLAQRTGAEFVALPGCGHWWPVQRPDEVAERLERHWAALE